MKKDKPEIYDGGFQNAALACVLFDCRNETNPFEGAAYWSQVLDQAATNTKLKKLLVAARIDVGGLPASKERIEVFAREHGFAQFIPTSASTGDGCDDLLEAIRQGIPWDEVPKVTTTDPAPLPIALWMRGGVRWRPCVIMWRD